MDVLSSILGFVVGIGILVFVHELGHFLMAKLTGVRVEKFSIGFPPKLFSFKYGETEYTIGATPLGGYVKMAGMIDEHLDDHITGSPDEFTSKNTFQKSLILLGGVLFNFFFAVLIFFSLNIYLGTTKILNDEIQSIHPKSPLKKYIPEDHIKILTVAGKDIVYYNDINKIIMNHLGDSYTITYQTASSEIKEAHIPENFKLSSELFSYMDFRYTYRSKVYIDSVLPNSIAAEIGLAKNDTMISLAGEEISSFSKLESLKEKEKNKQTNLVFKRASQLDTASILLKANDEGRVMIGFASKTAFPNREWIQSKFVTLDYTFGSALSASFKESVNSIALNLKSIRSIFRGDLDVRKSVGGPIAMADILGKSIGNIQLFLRMVAMISIMLAFMNVLPIPGLDGGHLLIVLIEGIRGKPLELETKMKVQKAGFALLFTLMIFVITNDISRYF